MTPPRSGVLAAGLALLVAAAFFAACYTAPPPQAFPQGTEEEFQPRVLPQPEPEAEAPPPPSAGHLQEENISAAPEATPQPSTEAEATAQPEATIEESPTAPSESPTPSTQQSPGATPGAASATSAEAATPAAAMSAAAAPTPIQLAARTNPLPTSNVIQTPAPDLSHLPPGLSDQPLEGEIAQSDSRVRKTSIRMVDRARQELAVHKPDEAIRTLGRVLSIDAGNPYVYFYLGRAYLTKRNYRQALIFWQRAAIGFSRNPKWLGETYGFEGEANERLGQLDEARQDYARALKLSPQNQLGLAGNGRLGPPAPVVTEAPSEGGEQAGEAEATPAETEAPPAEPEPPPPPVEAPPPPAEEPPQ